MSADGDITPIAVVIPCHDDGATLEQAVASVRGQDVAVEVIVVDDGSTDPGTAAVLRRLEGTGVRVLRQENQRPRTGAHARHPGHAAPSTCSRSTPTTACSRARCGCSATSWTRVRARSPRGAAPGTSAASTSSSGACRRSTPGSSPTRTTCPSAPSTGARPSLAAGGWQLDGGYEDWDLWMALAEAGHEGVGVPAVTGEYRVEPGRRLSRSSSRHAERCVRLRERHPRLYAERRRHRRASPAPVALKAALPVIDALPLSADRKRLLSGAACYLAYGSGWPTIAARMRAHRIRRAR